MRNVADKSSMFGNNVRKAMEKANLSVDSLSEMTKIDKKTIENIISGNSETVEKIDSDDVIKLASALNIEEAELLNFEE